MFKKHLICLTTLMLLSGCSLIGLPFGDGSPHPKESPLDTSSGQVAPDPRLFAADVAHRQVATPGLNALGFKAFNALQGEDPTANLALSPASLGRALLMAYAGARGSTRAAMASALGMPDQSEETLGNWAAATGPSMDKRGVAIQVCDSAWIRSTFSVLPSFTADLRNRFQAEVNTFSDSGDGTAKLQAWIKRASKDLLDGQGFQIGDDVMLALANVLTFDGRWDKVFEKAQTENRPFYSTPTDSRQVPMMHQTGMYKYAEDEGYQVVRLPYQHSVYAMYVLLPPESVTASESSLSLEQFDRLVSKARTNQGQIQLPRFSMKLHKPLTESLKAAGLAQAFSGAADFSGIAANLYLDQVGQEVRVAVDEEGTVAAAATVVMVGVNGAVDQPPPFNMEVNRPFYFVIRDDSTQGVLFMGKVVHPE